MTGWKPVLQELPVAVGLLFATVLVLAGALTALRWQRALRELAEEQFLADADRAYRRGQAKRRMATSALLVVIGGMIGGYYLSGMDARMDAIAASEMRGERQNGGPDPQVEADKQFAKRVGFYWIGVMVLVFAAGCLAILDFWHTRKYWMARYKELKADHDAKLQRDLAVFRQAKLNERVPGLKPPTPADDTATDEPPV